MLKHLLNKFSSYQSSTASRSKPKYDVYIHIGAPKSGTSALQKFLSEQHDELKKKGFYYPIHQLDQNGISGGHWDIGKALIDGYHETARNLFDDYLNQAQLHNCSLLLSAESFWGAYKSLPSLVGDLNVRYIAFYRHPLDLLLSNYNQLVKRHLSKLTLNKYLELKLNKPNRGDTGEILIDWYNSVDDSLTVYPYPCGSSDPNTILKVFLSSIGMCTSQFKLSSGVINRSYPPQIREFKRLINFVLPVDDRALDISIDRALQKLTDSGFAESNLYLQDEQLHAIERLKSSIEPIIKNIESHFIISIESSFQKHIDTIEDPIFLEEVSVRFKIFDCYPKVCNLVKSELAKSKGSYELYRLAELLNVSFDSSVIPDQLFDSKTYRRILNVNTEMADVLRDLAILYEKNGKKKEALELISSAFARRPNGPFIKKMKERLERDFKKIGESNDK